MPYCVTTLETPVSLIVDAPDTYTISEFDALEAGWFHTTPTILISSIAAGETKTFEFGNVCLGSGGGLTLGFWSNKNGQKLITQAYLNQLVALNLKNANDSDYNPTNASNLSSWLLSGTAVNMANMLSVQLAAMKLNVLSGKVNGSAMIYATDTNSCQCRRFCIGQRHYDRS